MTIRTIVSILCMFLVVGIGATTDWYFMTKNAKELNACVEYGFRFLQPGFQLTKCEPGQQPGDW